MIFVSFFHTLDIFLAGLPIRGGNTHLLKLNWIPLKLNRLLLDVFSFFPYSCSFTPYFLIILHLFTVLITLGCSLLSYQLFFFTFLILWTLLFFSEVNVVNSSLLNQRKPNLSLMNYQDALVISFTCSLISNLLRWHFFH